MVNTQDLYNRIISKYPDGVTADGIRYSDLSSEELTKRIVSKYPSGVTNDSIPYASFLVPTSEEENNYVINQGKVPLSLQKKINKETSPLTANYTEEIRQIEQPLGVPLTPETGIFNWIQEFSGLKTLRQAMQAKPKSEILQHTVTESAQEVDDLVKEAKITTNPAYRRELLLKAKKVADEASGIVNSFEEAPTPLETVGAGIKLGSFFIPGVTASRLALSGATFAIGEQLEEGKGIKEAITSPETAITTVGSALLPGAGKLLTKGVGRALDAFSGLPQETLYKVLKQPDEFAKFADEFINLKQKLIGIVGEDAAQKSAELLANEKTRKILADRLFPAVFPNLEALTKGFAAELRETGVISSKRAGTLVKRFPNKVLYSQLERGTKQSMEVLDAFVEARSAGIGRTILNLAKDTIRVRGGKDVGPDIFRAVLRGAGYFANLPIGIATTLAGSKAVNVKTFYGVGKLIESPLFQETTPALRNLIVETIVDLQ